MLEDLIYGKVRKLQPLGLMILVSVKVPLCRIVGSKEKDGNS